MRFVAFRGRIDRQTYFVATVLLYGSGLLFASFLAVGGANTDMNFPAKDIPEALRGITMPAAAGWTCVVIGLVGLLWAVVATFGISVRRLHDFGLTGFLVLLYPVLKHVIPDPNWSDWLPAPADLLWTLILIAQPGTRGPNAFGPDPREPPPFESNC